MAALTPNQEAFCRLVALPQGEDGVPVTPSEAFRRAYRNGRGASVQRLLKDQKVRERISALRAEADRVLVELLAGAALASKARRILRKSRHWERLCELIEARAAEPCPAPGYATGLLGRDVKQVAGQPVETYRLDKATLDALIALEESAARELGQLVDRRDLTSGGMPVGPSEVVIYLPQNER